MSRQDNKSLQLRGVPHQVLDRLGAAARRHGTTKNALVLALIRDYGAGTVTPKASPPAFDPDRKAAPYPTSNGDLAISGIPIETFAAFMERAKRDGWFSKNQLIGQLIDDYVTIAVAE